MRNRWHRHDALQTSISADADGPHDAASRPVDHIALHTQLDDECDHHATASVDIESTLLHRPTAVGCYSTCTVRLKLHWFDLLSTYCETRSQHIYKKSNRWSSSLVCMYSITSVYRHRCEQQRSVVDGIVALT